MTNLLEMEVTFEELFSAISKTENHTFEYNKEYFQNTKVEILNQNNEWCNVPAFIKKYSEIVVLTWSDGSVTKTARQHNIRTDDLNCKFAEDICIGDVIQKANGTNILCTEIISDKRDDVFDLQINSEDHLYQTSNGIVHHNTLLARTIARFLDVPFAMTDATSLTEAGYVGDDVENIIVNLYQAANGDVEKTQTGIIYIDEIDKLAMRGDSASITKDVGGEGVQQALLKILEGTICRMPPDGGRKHPGQEMVEIDTTNILFILGGAFAGLDKIIEHDLDKTCTTIGFGADVTDTGYDDAFTTNTDMYNHLEPHHIYKFGIIPEFVGRIPIFTHVTSLTEAQLMEVLTKPKNAILKQYQKMFELDNIKLTFTEDALKEIAKKAQQLKTGARGLRRNLESVLLDIEFNLINYKESGVKEIIITDKVIIGEGTPEFKK